MGLIPGNNNNSVRQLILTGVFWRILIIEVILLIGTLCYAAVSENKTNVELFWYGLRIISLVGIIIVFMTITLGSFLNRRIIVPLEALYRANKCQKDGSFSSDIPGLTRDLPKEIDRIVTSRAQMLDTILTVSEERLHLVNFIKNTFGRYLSKKVVDEILSSPEGQKIGGRMEMVTVLMSDLRGFTTLSETTDPEEMVLILNRYLETMSRVIVEHDGMIDEFIGDAILTVFGVPEKHGDEPLRGVACALAMQNALKELNKQLTCDGFSQLEMGIGISTGPAIVGNIGSEIRTKYGIVGPTINIASRIESNTVGGEVLLGDSTYGLIKDQVEVDFPRTVMMKGLTKPLVMYRVTAVGSPYNISLKPALEALYGIRLNLPFSCWTLDGKKISGNPISGETVMISENVITASVESSSLDLFTDIKLAFDFCIEAHCFSDIYLKVMSSEGEPGKLLYRLRITSIADEDRTVLKKWIAAST